MPGVPPFTTPNHSLIAARTSAQLRNKGPIGYNGTPQIRPQNCPFPSTITTHLIHLFLDRPHSHPKRHPDPISHFAIIHCGQTDQPTDRQTDGPGECSVLWSIAPLAMLIESDALIMAVTDWRAYEITITYVAVINTLMHRAMKMFCVHLLRVFKLYRSTCGLRNVTVAVSA